MAPRTPFRSLRRRSAGRDASGFTLIEILLTIIVLSIIMIPILAWTVVAFQRSADPYYTSSSKAFTELSRFIDRDLASSKSVQRWVPAKAATATTPAVAASFPADPCPVDSVAQTADLTNVHVGEPHQTWLVVRDSKNRDVVYLTDSGPPMKDGSIPTRLIRRACLNGVSSDPTVISDKVVSVPAPLDATAPVAGQTVPVSVSCTNRVGFTADSDVCGLLTVKVRAARGNAVTVKTTRRLGAVKDTTLVPVADIRCAPSCTQERDGSKSATIVFDGSYSSSPVGAATYSFTFDDSSIARQTPADGRTTPVNFPCNSSLPRWNQSIRGCVYKVTLTITDPRGQTAVRDQNVTVLNASPVVTFSPTAVNGFRSEWVCFDASGTVDPDDTSGTGLTYSWTFDDPAPGAVNSASGPGKPTVDCATEQGTAGVVAHQYTVTTGSAERLAALTVTDAEGVVQTFKIPVRVENKPPVAVITSTVSGVDIPSGEILWDATQSTDPDGNATHNGPSAVASYAWTLTDANGAQYKCCDETVATNVQGTKSGTLRLPAPGIDKAGVYTVTLTVADAEGQTATTTRIVNTNTRPRAAISKLTPKPLISPEIGESTITLDGGPQTTPTVDKGSYDVDQGGFIKSYKWEFWTAGTTSPPTSACSPSVAPPCYLTSGTTSTITFGPGQPNAVPYGSYRVKLVVSDDNNATNTCASVSPYSSTCIDDSSISTQQRWWKDIKINKAPAVTLATSSPTVCCTSAPITPTGLRQAYRRVSIQLGTTTATDPTNPTADTDGSIASYQWTITKAGGAPAPLLGSPSLTIANPVIQFVEPDKDYVVNLKLRVTDNDGAYSERTQSLWVRNNVPTASITVLNDKTAQAPVNNPYLTSWSTPDPVNQPATFRINSRGSTDPDGYVLARYWRIFKVPASGAQVQIAEFTDYNTNGTNCQIYSGTPVLDDPNVPNCAGFSYDFKEYGTFRVALETLDNDGGKTSADVTLKVNSPPVVSDFTVCPQITGVTCPPYSTVQNVDGTQGGFTFTPVAAVGGGGALKTYYWEWDDGSTPTSNSTAAAQLHRFDSVRPGTTTAKNGQWNVKLTVVDTENGSASLTKLVRFNVRPTAAISTTGSTGLTYQGLPVWRLNSCTPSGTVADTGVCTLPAVDASTSTDPDAQTTPAITEYRWFTPSYALANPGTGILTFNNAVQATGTSSTFPSASGTYNIGYNSFEGVQVFLGVKDGDNAWSSTGAGFRVTANRAPRLLKVDSPTASGTNGTVQRNVPTTFRVSTQDDLWFGATVTNFTLSFKDASGNPVTFQNASGASVTSVSGSAALEANGAGKPNCTTVGTGTANGSTWCPVVTLPTAANDLTAVLTATDSDGATLSLNNSVKYNVVDANPVAVVVPTDPAGAANPTVFTSTAATPPVFTVTLNGAGSYDPDGSAGFTSGPVSAYSWTTTGPSGTVGGGCTTGKIGPPVAQVYDLTCALPAVYGTYTINLTVFDAGGRTGSTDWVVKVNKAPVVSTLTATPNPAQGLVPVTFTATATDADGTVAGYRWDFNGDGNVDQTTTANTVTYTYPSYQAPGSNVFVAGVVAVDSSGGLSTDNAGGLPVPAKTVSVVVNQQPTSAFTINRTNGGDCGSASPCVVNLPTPYSVSVNGTANVAGGSSDVDGSVTTYAWTITTVSGGGTAPTLPGNVPTGSLTFPGPGLYNVTLKVTDNNLGTGTVTRQVRVNTAPVTTLGGTPPYNCVRQPSPTSPASCTITATSTDAENDAISSYTWEFLDAGGTRIGSLVTTATGSVSPVFTSTGTGTVKVYATDANGGQSTTVSAAFTVANQPPTVSVASSPSPATITPTNAGALQFVTLTATASDPDGGTITYAWSVKNAGGTEVLTGSAATLQVGPGATSPLPAGRYNVTVTVSDGQGGSTTSAVVPVVVNRAPTAVATVSPTVVNEGAASSSVSFSGTGTTDPDGDPIASYAWAIAGPGGFTATATGATPAAVDLPSFGTYVATLTVTDNLGGVGTTTVSVKRNKLPLPAAKVTPTPQTTPATADCALAPSATCTVNPTADLRVDASTSSDPDGSLVTYGWKLWLASDLAANPNATPTATASGITADIARPAGGLYVLELTVTDDSGATASLRGNVNVNRAPVVSIDGPATLLVDRGADTQFSATASDPEALPLTSFVWTFTSGGTTLLTRTTTDPSTVENFPALVSSGTLSLRVTDADGAVTTVTKPFQVRNQVPRAVLNQDPTDTVGSPGFVATFSSSSIDNDGQVLTTNLQICPDPAGGAGCASYDLQAGAAQVTFPNFGTYTLNLSVTDDDGATGTLSPVPTIKINRPPTAVIKNAGTLTTPVNVNFTLDGTLSTDADGTISQYLWAFDSGPVALAPGSGSAFTQKFTVAGTYVVRLIVFDDSGASSETTANVVVTP